MNNFDFEKTQVWAKSLIDTPVAAQGTVFGASAAVKPLLPDKMPILKPLTKEEKIILATGGALAIGLGAIVISSFSDESNTPAPNPDLSENLTAPRLNLAVPEIAKETAFSKVEQLPHAPSKREHKNDNHSSDAVQHATKSDLHHAILEIPDVPPVACVGDEMTFIEAFDAARKEVGPAGLFAWRDTFYSTFTDNEWNLVAENDKERWLSGAEPIIHPDAPVEEMVLLDIQQNVIVADRGPITWTGIDKDGDGNAEMLMARIHGQPPLVLMDTDGDGVLDTRYDYDSATGKTYASVIDPITMSIQDIEKMEYFPEDSDLGFFSQNSAIQATGPLPVVIYQEGDVFLVSMDSNLDNTVDAVTYLSDDRGPVVGLDFDNDGKIEMGYVYDSDTQTIKFIETDPLQEMNFGPPESPAVTTFEPDDFPHDYDSAALSFEENESPDDPYENSEGNSDEILS